MSQLPPPPPPPPLPCFDKSRTNISNCTSSANIKINDCEWAANYPELHKGCYLAKVCELNTPRQCHFLNIGGQLQEGPTCGLTALSMISKKSCEELLSTAKKLNYTNNGEMYSAHNLYQLISGTLRESETSTDKGKNLENAISCQLHAGALSCSEIKDALMANACLFVPYSFE